VGLHYNRGGAYHRQSFNKRFVAGKLIVKTQSVLDMKNFRFFVLIISLLFHFFGVFGQEKTVIRGRITDKSTGHTLPGVNIVELDDQNRVVKGVITDVNGNYVLEVNNSEHTITVSYIGYQAESFNINSRTQINIELESQSTELDEIVITAKSRGDELTGVAERDRTGSAMEVNMEKLSGSAGVDLAASLQGQVSGLDIVSASGGPGSGSSIVIRGMGTLGNANPLVVVNGIPQDVETQEFNFASADQHDLGQLLNIAPQDIKSVTVLKDAASTAVWGSKGANGVLLIETLKGTKGNIQFSYQYKVSANIEPPQIPMLNGDEYITMQLEQWHNAEAVYTIPPEIAYDRNHVDFYNYSANTDWLAAITQDSYTHDHFFKMSGGGERSNYYTSVNYQNELGTTVNTSFRRFSVRSNFDYEISKNLRFTTDFTYTNTFVENNPDNDRYSQPRNIRWMSYIKAPNMSIWEHDESGSLTGEYFIPIESYQGSGSLLWNPVAIADLGKNDVAGNNIQNNFKIDYRINDWIRFRESISFSYVNKKGNRFIPATAIGAAWYESDNNNATERNSADIRWLSRSQLFFFPFQGSRNHDLTGVLMWEMEEKRAEWTTLSTNRSPSIGITDPASGAPIGWTGSESMKSRLFGAFSSLNYKYKDRYLLNVNIRADGNSAFGQNNQWGIFPSVSMGWRFSNESFFQTLTFLNDSKLRLSWGQSGSAVNNPYATYAYYETTNRYMGNPAIVPGQIELANLRWQTSSSWNGGIDLNLFNSRVTITADVYNRITKDLLHNNYKIPSLSGYSQLDYFNGGEIQNIGWEYFMRGDIINKKDIRFSLNFNISQNHNSFLSFPENFLKERGSSIGNGVYPRKAEIGKPIGSFYGFRYLGVYSSDDDAIARDGNGNIMRDSNGNPIQMSYKEEYEFRGGDAKYDDINHDGRIDIMDAVYIGNSSPEFIGGFGSFFEYKQFSASVDFHYRLGYDIVNQVAMDTEGMLNRNNQSMAVLHRWKRQGQDEEGMLPRAYMNHPANNLGSDRYVESGDFLRLNNINFNYKLSPTLAKRLNVNSLSIGLTIRKLLTFTNYSGQDPAIARVSKDPFWMGRDNARTPPPKEYSLRMNINF
jgi:TonB-linked SusC/RagA family outer membrane protein